MVQILVCKTQVKIERWKFGQYQNDIVVGSLGADTLMGGSGNNEMTSDSSDLDVRSGSDNRPKLESLEVLKANVFTTMVMSSRDVGDSADTRIPWGQQLATDMMTDDTMSTVNSLPFDQLAGNFVVTDEQMDLSTYRPYTNPANKLDVNNDGHVSPLDVLWIVNEMNSQGAQSLPTMRGWGAKVLVFVDPNSDGQLSSLDALLVVNELNDRAMAEGELQASASHDTEIESPFLGTLLTHPASQPPEADIINTRRWELSPRRLTPWVNRPVLKATTENRQDSLKSEDLGEFDPCLEAEELLLIDLL